ncbi:MAG TPA: O-methyltransferase [Bacilli bacterium]|jgi:predicted O-methyltransferase YrrM|nr:O-methyltransferase [Acholeplasmataceae bacterium]HNZ73837.1 O-methyltransferase [Bacilli bacterium]HPA98825.1 O-methyltransferase [Bacilli bacterium]HPX82877.1 O-methyltransferase [Bacilli bacterium]HQM17987.1 O-methyltransferase [Bacilli bacterium]
MSYLEYLNTYLKSKLIEEMEEDAKINKVPIISKDSLSFLFMLIDLKKPKRILEIGTAIGYCAINLASFDCDLIVDSIERDEALYNKAKANVSKAKLEKRINLYLADALTIDNNELKSYDLIFIDGAKAQYEKFFNKFKSLLKEGGIIVSDNLLFHNLLFEENVSKNVKGLTDKIKKYNLFLKENEEFKTYFFQVGDGIGVSIKK